MAEYDGDSDDYFNYEFDRICSYPCEWCGEVDYSDEDDDEDEE